MNNTNLDVFAEGEGKTAEFIAYLTNRVPYFDSVEKKYVLLTKEKISEHIKKANSEGDSLKAFELLEAAKKSFGITGPLLSAQIISKSVRVPGDAHLKLLAKNFNLSKSIKEAIYPRMEIILEELKKLEGVNNEKLQQILSVFTAWKDDKLSEIVEQVAETATELRVFSAAEIAEMAVESDNYSSNFSNIFRNLVVDKNLVLNKKFVDAATSVLIFRAKAIGKENGMSPGDIEKAFSRDNWDREITDWDQTLIRDNTQKQEFSLFFHSLICYSPKDIELLNKEIGNKWFNDSTEDFFEGYGDFYDLLMTFDYEALLRITEDSIFFEGKPLLEENKDWISTEIFKDLCKQCEFKNPNMDEINAQMESLINKGEFEKATELQKQVVEFKQLSFLARIMAECLLNVLKTSKVVTFTMPAALLGLFEANASFILEPSKSKKQEGAH